MQADTFNLAVFVSVIMAATICIVFMLLPYLVCSRPTPCDDGFHDFLPCSTRGWILNGPASYVDPTGPVE
jgi:hypothetical protein